jgi:hypothetical protein
MMQESSRFVRNAIHMKNTLYYGDNLEIMRAHMADSGKPAVRIASA